MNSIILFPTINAGGNLSKMAVATHQYDAKSLLTSGTDPSAVNALITDSLYGRLTETWA